MPHYADGTEANTGDVVTGIGYNVKHPISGVVVAVVPDSEACNIQVMHTSVYRAFDKTFPCQSIEYGETKAFTKVG